MRSIPSLDNGRLSDMQVTDAEAGLDVVPDVVPDVALDVALEAEMAAAAVNTRGTDSNTGIDIQMDNFDR